MFIFRVIILCFLEIFKAREFGILVQGVFFSGVGEKRGFVRSPRDFFFGGGVDFCPHSIIAIPWNFYFLEDLLRTWLSLQVEIIYKARLVPGKQVIFPCFLPQKL